jgi:flagellar basal-body rod protein FlgB
VLDDVTMSALEGALNGLSARQSVIADNLANVQTPGFTARTVDFEASLRSALETGSDPHVAPTEGRSAAPARQDGNNVAVDDETVGLVQTGLRYQLMVEALNNKYGLLRTAMQGGA